MLIFIRFTERKGPQGQKYALYRCDNCKEPHETRVSDVNSGNTTSCGCSRTKHGLTNSPEYSSWGCMRYRCYNKDSERYKDYGGRGIIICERWKDSFENFYEDMGPKPSPELSIERINNNGNYEPGNCKWGTDEEQRNNKRSSRNIPFNGKTQTLKRWSKELNISVNCLRSRLYLHKWSIERAFTTPVREGKRKPRDEFDI